VNIFKDSKDLSLGLTIAGGVDTNFEKIFHSRIFQGALMKNVLFVC
jgi:hypothetical protein